MGPVHRILTGAVLAGACGLFSACGHARGDSTGLVKHPVAGMSGPTGDAGPSDLVAAVSGGGADEGPVGLKFQVGQRPVAGKPTTMMLRLIANQPLEHVEARFRPDDGLAVTDGGTFDPEGRVELGTALDHTLTLLPAHDGIYTVMATVTTGLAAEAVSRSFVIPIVVGTSAGTMNVSATSR